MIKVDLAYFLGFFGKSHIGCYQQELQKHAQLARITENHAFVNQIMATPTQWKSQLIRKETIAQDIVELHIQKPEGFSYLAGQFIQFVIPTGGDSVLRAYSLASHPAQDDLEFCMKLLPGGKASMYFSQATQDAVIAFQGPSGKFTCTKDDLPISFIATGAGLAPIWGMISDELKNKKNSKPLHLLFGVRGEEDVFWIERLRQLGSMFRWSGGIFLLR